MIKNERQYRITKAQADKLEQTLSQWSEQSDTDNQTHPLLLQAYKDAMESQLAELRAQLAEYEALRSGAQPVLGLEDLHELPRALIRARIAAGLSQKELAERIGVKEQQIQYYESTNYSSTSLARIQEIIQALGVGSREETSFPSTSISLNTLFTRLSTIGLESDFIIKKLIPRSLIAHLEEQGAKGGGVIDSLVYQIGANVGRALGLTAKEIFSSQPLTLNITPVTTARYKLPSRADELRTNAYTLYAHFLALLVLEVTEGMEKKPIPADAAEVRRELLSKYGSLTYEHALRYVWDLGIPVLALNDPSAFHGACWRIAGRNVIILKQRTSSEARWLFDLLHELRHAGQAPEQDTHNVIESGETAQERRDSAEEREASQFAGDVILAGRADELAKLCTRVAQRKIPKLKAVVQQIAMQETVPVASLANYMAFRMSLEGQNWWSTANNLQGPNTNPWQIARDIFIEHVNLDRLNEVDRALLLQALSDDKADQILLS